MLMSICVTPFVADHQVCANYNSCWRPLLDGGALVNQLQHDVLIGHLLLPDATLDNELQPVK
jgi:hypothetical protein